MQTFLPYPDFDESAKCLDRQRLGKQRVEVLQILKALMNNGGWANHPATKMWRGYVPALVCYGVSICTEWRHRGYKDTCLSKMLGFYDIGLHSFRLELPYWIGDSDFHLAHKSNLLRKFPEYYGKFWKDVPDNLPYVWPHTQERI